MNKLTIVRSSNTISIDGRALQVDCSSLDPNIAVVQWNEHGDGTGHIEFSQPGQSTWLNGTLTSVDGLHDFQPLIDAWNSAAALIENPPPLALAPAKANKKILIREDAVRAAVGGNMGPAVTFPSDALGSTHGYPTDELSQMNLTAGVLASLLPGNSPDWTTPMWCTDANGVWAFVEHTAAQIQTAGRDGKAFFMAVQRKHADLQARIDAATTIGAVNAIKW